MDGDTKWEEAWRAFDADIQAINDFGSIGEDNLTEPKGVFDKNSDDFDVTPAEVCTIPDLTRQYEKAWRRLGAWIYREDPTIKEAAAKYRQINQELGLDDDIWNELCDSEELLDSSSEMG